MKRTLLLLTLLVSLNSFGQMLMDWNYSSCSERSYPEFIKRRIVYQERNEDTLHLRIALVLNCCIDPELKLSKSNDSLFVWVENTSDIICACECCFEIEMELTEIVEDSLKVFYVKEDMDFFGNGVAYKYISKQLLESTSKYAFPSPDELAEFENYEGETNQLSENGEKIGLWKHSTETRNYLMFYSIDDHGKRASHWRIAYSLEGELEEICGFDGLDGSTCADAHTYNRLFGIEEKKPK